MTGSAKISSHLPPRGLLGRSRVLATCARLLLSLAVVAGVTHVCATFLHVNPATAGFLYLLVILGVATKFGLFESTIVSVAAMLSLNFFFIPPTGTFTIADPQNWVAMLTFLATSLTASQLSERLKRERREAVVRQRELEQLYAFSRGLLLADPSQPVPKQIAEQIARTFDLPAVALYERTGNRIFFAGAPFTAELESRMKDSALQSAVITTEDGGITITPIRLGGEPIGSLALSGSALSDAALQSLLNLAAVGLERSRAQEQLNRAEVARESQELKSAVLEAIAHEFKTPLTSIKAATTDLIEGGPELRPEHREMLAIADEAADRLSALVTDAIQLARIEGGKFHLNSVLSFPDALITSVLRQMQSANDGREVRHVSEPGLPPVYVDAEMIQLVLRNLIDNARKYAAADSPIVVGARLGGKGVEFSVRDSGPGIAEEEQLRIFEKFYRGTKERYRATGTGMGLAIAREIVRAHGGEIGVHSKAEAGTEFFFSVPIASV